MSGTTLPGTTARATTGAAILGILAVSIERPYLGLSAATGAVLAVALIRASQDGRYVLPAAMLPVGVLGVLGVLGLGATAGVIELAFSLLGVVLGISTAGLLVGKGIDEPAILERMARQGLFVSTAAVVFTVVLRWEGGVADLGVPLGFVPPSAIGLAVLVFVTGFSLTVAVLVMPHAMFPFTANTDPGRAASAQRSTAGVLLVSTLAGSVLVGLVSGLPVIPSGLVDSLPRDALLTALVGPAVVLALLGLLARWSWYSPDSSRDPVVLLALGTVVGFLVAVGAIAALGGPPGESSYLMLYVLLLPCFGFGWFVFGYYTRLAGRGSVPSPATVTALGLGLSGLMLATTIPDSAPAGTNQTGAIAVIAIGVGLFVHRAGRLGQRLQAEVGADGVDRRPQLVRVGWIGTLAAVGVFLAVGGLWSSTVLAPALPVSAAASTVLGCLALLAGIVLLLDSESA